MTLDLQNEYLDVLQKLLRKWLQHNEHVSVNTLEFAKDIMQNIGEPLYSRGWTDSKRWP